MRVNRFQRIALTTIAATYLLIGLGGFVRAAGAGLGCPDWPRCFERWIPPTDVSQLPNHIDPSAFDFELAWIEYVNRLVGVVVGFLILATAGIAWRDHRHTSSVLTPCLLAVALVAFQGWLGGQVVAYELDPRLVTVHLIVALAIVTALIYAAAAISGATSGPSVPCASTASTRLRHLAAATLVLTVAQILLGALVRGSIDVIGAAIPDLERQHLLPQVGWLDDLHRTAGLLMLVACCTLSATAWRAAPAGSALARFCPLPAAFAITQFAAGLGLAYLSLPPSLQVVHILVASLLFGSVFLTLLLTRRSDSAT